MANGGPLIGWALVSLVFSLAFDLTTNWWLPLGSILGVTIAVIVRRLFHGAQFLSIQDGFLQGFPIVGGVPQKVPIYSINPSELVPNTSLKLLKRIRVPAPYGAIEFIPAYFRYSDLVRLARMVADIKENQPNPSFNPDATSASYFPHQAY